MTRIKTKERRGGDDRCAVCRDGPDGLVVCRGCNTLLHASCLIDVRGCPTLGCNERDPLQAQQDRCQHHALNAVDKSCMACGASHKEIVWSRSRRSVEHKAIQCAEVGPKKEHTCNHRWNPTDYRCDYCHLTMEEFARTEGLVDSCIESLAQVTKEFGAEVVMNSFEVTCGEQRGAGRVPWGAKDYAFWMVMILPPLLAALYQLLRERV